MANITQPSEEQIRTRAYYLWEADGRPQGRDWEYWMKAQQEFAPQAAVVAATPATPTRSSGAAKNTRTEAVTTPKRASKRTVAYA